MPIPTPTRTPPARAGVEVSDASISPSAASNATFRFITNPPRSQKRIRAAANKRADYSRSCNSAQHWIYRLFQGSGRILSE
jgi:hypothetical protein